MDELPKGAIIYKCRYGPDPVLYKYTIDKYLGDIKYQVIGKK